MRQLLAVGVKTSSCLENVQLVQEKVRRTCSTLLENNGRVETNAEGAVRRRNMTSAGCGECFFVLSSFFTAAD